MNDALSAKPGGALMPAASVCRRCGQCCLRGGATLMPEDAPLLTRQALPLEALVCLRAGEWARDDARMAVRPLETELLKLAGAKDGGRVADPAHPWRCRYYSHDGQGCGIYEHRPVQCQILFCADTTPLEALLARGPGLSRRAALAALPEEVLSAAGRALWQELAAAHEEACPAGRALELATALGFRPKGVDGPARLVGAEQGAAREALAEMVRHDAAFRELCAGRGGVPLAVQPFLLGRPLAELLQEVGCAWSRGV